MNLIPWRNKKRNDFSTEWNMTPFLTRFRGEMDRVFHDLMRDPWGTVENAWPFSGVWNPQVDVTDGPREVTVRAELPGVDPQNLDVSVTGNLLTISGEKREECEQKDGGVYRSECRYGQFRRTIRLPEGTSPDKVNAEYNNGVLQIRIGKREESIPKPVKISVGRGGNGSTGTPNK